MCNPATIAMTTAMMAINAVQWKMGENQKAAARESATNSLANQRSAEGIRNTQEELAAQAERSKIQRKTRLAQGQLATLAANRGTSASSALQQAHSEFEMREGEYQSAISAKRDQQLLAGGVRDSARVSQWQGRMMQNASTGPLGLALALGTGYMQGQSMSPTSPDIPDMTAGHTPTSNAMMGQAQTYGYQKGFGVGPWQSASPELKLNPMYNPQW